MIKRGRGRPRKNIEYDPNMGFGRDPRKHIQVEAGRAIAGNLVEFTHNDGQSTVIDARLGHKILAYLGELKPRERQDKVLEIHETPEGLKF